MIRAALITIAFLGLTLTLILMQPASLPSRVADVSEPALQAEAKPYADNMVARAETDLGALAVVTDVLDETAAMTKPAASEPVAPAALPEPQPDDASTTGIAASVAALPARSAAPKAAPASELERLIINALSQGQSESYIDALVNDAAHKGKVEVPASLITADGRVDTGYILAALSQPPQAELGPGSIYVVQPGDSLASISYRYYGSTGRAADIFLANRAVLSSPSVVEAGQTLALPEF